MSKSSNMLRTRRKDNNVKPNRRLDRKSSRGMLFENEELRLKTININAEVERGQSDIKKLKRENDQLRREIWYLRDEYDKLDKLLREKEQISSSSSSSCSSETESSSSYTESNAIETSQNLENVQKTNQLNQEYDHLSIVPEENSTENSDRNSGSNALSDQWKLPPINGIIQPDQSYPAAEKVPKHFFSPIKPIDDYINNQFLGPEVTYERQFFQQHYDQFYEEPHPDYFQSVTLPSLSKTSSDVIAKTDNQFFNTLNSKSSFSNGGNLEELLNDIENISHDILKISRTHSTILIPGNEEDVIAPDKPYKSELNVVLFPTPMELIEIDKYKNLKTSCESLSQPVENVSASYSDFTPFVVPVPPLCPGPLTPGDILSDQTNPFYYESVNKLSHNLKDLEICSSKTNLIDTISSDHISSENEENLKFKTSKPVEVVPETPLKAPTTQKVSIQFKAKKDKADKPKKYSFFDKFISEKDTKKVLHQKTPSVDSKNSLPTSESRNNKVNESSSASEQKSCMKASDHNKNCKSSSASPERSKHLQKETKKHKKHKKSELAKNRRASLSAERLHRERSYSVCTDRSNVVDRARVGLYSMYDDFMGSDRERTNSMSSCETLKGRKLSNISHLHQNGKIPWCGCWGNGCI